MRFAYGNGLYDHEVVLWLGDLNYRLNCLSYEDVVKECNSNRYQQLFHFDQVSNGKFIFLHQHLPPPPCFLRTVFFIKDYDFQHFLSIEIISFGL